jgi:hypothetical protein
MREPRIRWVAELVAVATALRILERVAEIAPAWTAGTRVIDRRTGLTGIAQRVRSADDLPSVGAEIFERLLVEREFLHPFSHATPF